MLLLLSPAKALDYTSPLATSLSSQPVFVPEATALIEVLRRFTPAEVASLMGLSDALAGLNVARYQAWEAQFSAPEARPAVLAFDGDVYDGLQARALPDADLQWLQSHLCILSGLYGVLRPLDLMRPYRLEMGTRLATPQGRNLYQFWGTRLADYLNQRLDADPVPVLVNLASEEYAKSIDRPTLRHPMVQCVFEEWKTDRYRVISFMAKRARGLMTRFAVTERARSVDDLKAFAAEGYRYVDAASTPGRLVFRRDARP